MPPDLANMRGGLAVRFERLSINGVPAATYDYCQHNAYATNPRALSSDELKNLVPRTSSALRYSHLIREREILHFIRMTG